MAIPEEEIKYRQNLTDDQHSIYRQVRGAWINLGLEGCGSCEFTAHVNNLLAPIELVWGKVHILGRLSHSAIQLNGLKRESEEADNSDKSVLQRQKNFDEDKLFANLMNLGLPEEEFDVVCAAFKKCIDCDGALKTVGRNRTFEETKAILESQKE